MHPEGKQAATGRGESEKHSRGGTKGRPLREPGRGAVEHHQFAEGRLSVFNLALGGFQSRLNPAGSTLRHSGRSYRQLLNARARAEFIYARTSSLAASFARNFILVSGQVYLPRVIYKIVFTLEVL